MTADELVSWAREHRQGTPDGDIREPAVLVDVLKLLLRAHLDRTEPQPAPDRLSDQPTGWTVIPGAVPPARTPATCDPTARALATLLSYLADARC